ncbi:MAG TPA: metallophosphoesterase family protein [Gaiellaceae bacterium]|nr:metallophosphoesterase family protein [Gaiellaceae bacterium]
MRIAVISDVHANLYALEAVLGEIDRAPPDELWCLGDTVGYGPHPNECCSLVRERSTRTLVGNHDLVALGSGEVGVEDFNLEAAGAALWTHEQLTDESRAFLSSLEPRAELDGFELFHGSPRDPVWDYVLDDVGVATAFALTKAPIVMVGHSHLAIAAVLTEGTIEGGAVQADFSAALGAGRWLLNPGSVGQPRDGDPRASWLEVDTESGAARFRRIAYPVARTQAEIRERGLPDALAERLAHGV